MFRFRLQRVLELREKREQEVAGRLADARTAEEQAREQCAALQSARDEGMQRATAAQGSKPTVGQLQNLRFVVERLNHEIEQASRDAELAELTVQERLAEFASAFRDRKVLDRLKDRDRESWATEEVKADRQTMDGIALTGFVRGKATRPNGEG